MLMFMAVMFSSSAVYSFSAQDETAAKNEIISKLQKWPAHFNDKNVAEICAIFAPDLVACSPGVPDKGYDAMRTYLTDCLGSADKQFHYDPPAFEQVFVDGNIAIARLILTQKITSENGTKEQVTKQKSIYVFKRQPDKSWKIVMAYAFPE